MDETHMSLSLKDAKVVVVEDDPNSTLATVELLKLDGVNQIHTFTNGKTTLDFLKNAAPVNLLLLDIHMPGETGYDLLKRVRALPDPTSRAKIVALTAGVLYDDIRRARQAGFDGFIGKPLKPKAFAQQVQRILNGEAVWEWR